MAWRGAIVAVNIWVNITNFSSPLQFFNTDMKIERTIENYLMGYLIGKELIYRQLSHKGGW